ncbi:MAG: hypothetical protein IT545_04875 [Rhodobacteraceae bacterium]|nr:hypothetical protein [Paracoccaceae bacterium]
MLVKIVALFLVGIAALAIFGRFRAGRPRAGRKAPPARLARARLCSRCHRLLVGPEPCDCGGDGPGAGSPPRRG